MKTNTGGYMLDKIPYVKGGRLAFPLPLDMADGDTTLTIHKDGDLSLFLPLCQHPSFHY
jgi:hypothetical protein